MNRKAVAQELTKVAKLLTSSERVIATNRSSNSWEDFSSFATAKVYADDTGNLRLEIREDVENVGINSYKRSAVVATQDLGTLNKPRLGGVSSLLKKHGHDRSRAGGPFSSKWTDANGQKSNLTQIITVEAERAQPVPVAVAAPSIPSAKPVPTTEDQAVLKQLLKDVDIGTIGVEEAHEKVEQAIRSGDRKKAEYALGALESAIERLVSEAEGYRKVVRQLAQ